MTRFIYLPPGAVIKVFDNVLWNGKDVGDNSQFWKEATVIEVVRDTVTVRFHHDNRVSKGHFIDGVREVEWNSR